MLMVTQYATEHDEKGERMPLTLDPDQVKPYWASAVEGKFDETIRPHVFMLLKYFGDFKQMSVSEYFHNCV